jgi:hypothetical protein
MRHAALSRTFRKMREICFSLMAELMFFGVYRFHGEAALHRQCWFLSDLVSVRYGLLDGTRRNLGEITTPGVVRTFGLAR